MQQQLVESPSKINLGLNVIHKRKDGYHDLETIFYPLMLKDIISFKRSDRLRVSTNSSVLKEEKNNIIYKACRLLEEHIGTKVQFEIIVEKKIPIGGGLGGGSSNAATTLKILNKLMNIELEYSELHRLALKLGSDVPYFLEPQPAFAQSRGEILSPLNLEISYPILLVNPRINIDTSWAFSQIEPRTHEVNLIKIGDEGNIDFEIWKRNIKNDFEEIVFNHFPSVGQIKKELYSFGAQFALMSGTGSTVYGIFSNLQKAIWAEEYFRQKYFTFLQNPFDKSSFT